MNHTPTPVSLPHRARRRVATLTAVAALAAGAGLASAAGPAAAVTSGSHRASAQPVVQTGLVLGEQPGGQPGELRVEGRLPAAGAAVAAAAAGNPRAYAFVSRTGRPTAPIARWNPCAGPIGWRLNPARARPQALVQAREAFRRLSAATGLSFAYRGTTRVVPGARGSAPYPKDTKIVLAFVTPGQSGYLPKPPPGFGVAAGQGGGAFSSGAVDAKGRPALVFSQGFAIFNTQVPLATGFGAGPTTGVQGTMGQLMMHELGHAVGLAHPTILDPRQIMYPALTRKTATWGAGDVNGLRAVGRAGGCLRSAR